MDVVTLTNTERVWEENFGGPTKAWFRMCCPWDVYDIAVGHLSLGSEEKTLLGVYIWGFLGCGWHFKALEQMTSPMKQRRGP